jgi:hypothetical protein
MPSELFPNKKTGALIIAGLELIVCTRFLHYSVLELALLLTSFPFF